MAEDGRALDLSWICYGSGVDTSTPKGAEGRILISPLFLLGIGELMQVADEL
jgi:hypothetical protein